MTKQQRLVLLVSILASFVAFLDIAIVNVALPAIQKSLGGGLSSQQWVIDAYLITLGSLILIAGSLSDLLGRKRILWLGLLGFGVASILCAIAPNIQFLIVSRALQGIAGALLVPSSLAIIISTFSGPAQGKAIGTWTAWTGISFLIGPVVGGLLVDKASWRWVFAINVIPIAVTLWLMRRMQISEHIQKGTPVDITGALLCALGLGGAVFALIEQPRYGWGDPLILLPLIAGLSLFTAFLLYESKAKHPMLPLGLFKNHNFSVGNVATVAIYAGLTASTFVTIVYLQQVGGYSALKAGLAFVPVTILMFLLSPRFGALAGKYGPRLFMGVGPLLAAAGFLLMLRIHTNVNYWNDLLPAVIVFGIGLSITVAPLTAAILGDVEKEHSGIASAINNAIARVAGLIAVAAVGAVIAAQFNSQLDKQAAAQSNWPWLANAVSDAKTKPLTISPPTVASGNADFKNYLVNASESAFHAGIVVIAGLIAVGGVVSLIGIRNPNKTPETEKAAA